MPIYNFEGGEMDDRPIIYPCPKCGLPQWNLIGAKPCKHGKKDDPPRERKPPWVEVKPKAKALRGGL